MKQISALVSTLVFSTGCGVFLPGVWYDEQNDLMWEDPPSSSALFFEDAVARCQGLSAYGRTDWRLPNIDQLRSIVAGCDKPCDVTTTCNTWIECNSGCSTGCPLSNGPGRDECYWHEALSGKCGDLFEDYWSSTTSAGSSSTGRDHWVVDFQRGSIGYEDGEFEEQLVRCVALGEKE